MSQSTPPSTQGHILAVDDTPANLEIITEILSTAGYTVMGAISGERALKRLKSHTPDLILLDVQMPGLDGFAVCQAIKEIPAIANIPIIFITALSDVGNMMRGFSLGAVDYISKPFQELEVLMRVKNHLQLYKLTEKLEQQVVSRTLELQSTLAELNESRLQLIQQEKMSAMGNLVAEVAHDINNPVAFLHGSIDHAQGYMEHLVDHIDLYRNHYPESIAAITEHSQMIDLDFILQDLPKLFAAMDKATCSIASISQNLCNFARKDPAEKVATDLHRGIDNTLQILKHRLQAKASRPLIEVIKDYGELPAVACFPGQINQVLMNLLVNAADALDEAHAQGVDRPPQIRITTKVLPSQAAVVIAIGDNGTGMTDEVKTQALDNLFTTKPVGQGTGLGLAIAQQIVQENHGGQLTFQSTWGEGTEFQVQLPIQARDRTAPVSPPADWVNSDPDVSDSSWGAP